MPYTRKQRKLMRNLVKQYGATKAIQVYHAMENSGKYSSIFGKKKSKKSSGKSNSERKPELGTGERFQRLVTKLKAKGAKNPKALAAWIGRRKYGAKRFQKLAAAGRKQAS